MKHVLLTQTLLQRDAAIVNITSATTRVATVGVAPYATFKGGLEVLTRYIAKELGSGGFGSMRFLLARLIMNSVEV